MNEKPTPETDAHIKTLEETPWSDWVYADFARRLERERDEARELRNGDNLLVEALAKAAGIAITCNPKMLGIVWEQFHDGVLGLKRERDEAMEKAERYRLEANAMMLQRDQAIEEATRRKVEFDHLFHANELAKKITKERDEAQEELSSIYRWVERHNQDGFDDKLTHRQNVDICYDLLYDRLDIAELELNRIKRAVIATLDENRHLADGNNCTLIKLKTAVPTWE